MKILLLSSSYNSLTQRAHVELTEMGYDISVELAISDGIIRNAIQQVKPQLIICPMLTYILPDDIWEKTPCIIIHPGIKGDRGASSLDWAILQERSYWGVTAVQAAPEVDSGPIWATGEFSMRAGSKSSVYRDELASCAIKVIKLVAQRFESGLYVPEPLDYSRPDVKGQYRDILRQPVRAVNWKEDSADTIIRKIRSADSFPGLLDTFFGDEYYMYGAHREGKLIGPPGKMLATRHGAICIATVDGAVWVTHLRRKTKDKYAYFKLPATQALAGLIDDIPESDIDLLYTDNIATYKEIWYREHKGIAYLYFEFYNGAMSTDQCKRLTEAFEQVSMRPEIKVVVLMGGRDFWSNGIHLNTIEAADDPAQESWANINAINDFVKAVLTNTDQYVLSAMHGNSGAGGVMMALAADAVIARQGVTMNPHYRGMGGLYGSEYWTYLLPKRVGHEVAIDLTQGCKPIGAEQAKRIGLIDDVIYEDEFNPSSFHDQVVRIAEKICTDTNLEQTLLDKELRLARDEQEKPIEQYRDEELANMRENFFGDNKAYHVARSHFVRKVPATQGMLPMPTPKATNAETEEPIAST